MMLVCDPWMGHINDMISCIYDSYYEAGNCSDVKRRKEDLQFNIIINFPQHQVLAKLGPGHLGLGQLGPGAQFAKNPTPISMKQSNTLEDHGFWITHHR